MGIKGEFYKFLNELSPKSFVKAKFNPAEFKNLAVDIPIYLNKYKVTCEDWKEEFEVVS